MTDHLINAYARLPVAIERGEGAWLWDTEGNRYLDAVSGIAVCSLGHSHPAIAEAVADQSRRLVLSGNGTRVPLQEQLAERLTGLTGLDRVFLANSGAEAVECAFKLARLHARQRGIAKPEIIVAERSFHGRTLACLSASGSRKVQAGFEPLVPGFVRVPYDDPDALAAAAKHNPNVVAVLTEPIQGEGGVVVPGSGYLQQLRAICDRNDWLLILDEIQTGMCRTGAWYACQHRDVTPDILCTAKALGNGFPVSACVAREEIGALIHPGKHGSTFGGNALACRVALTVIDIMESEDLSARARDMGERLIARLRRNLEGHPAVRDIRGAGLMIGVQLDRDAHAARTEALTRGLLINVTAGDVIRLLPPLIIDASQADLLADGVAATISAMTANSMARSA